MAQKKVGKHWPNTWTYPIRFKAMRSFIFNPLILLWSSWFDSIRLATSWANLRRFRINGLDRLVVEESQRFLLVDFTTFSRRNLGKLESSSQLGSHRVRVEIWMKFSLARDVLTEKELFVPRLRAEKWTLYFYKYECTYLYFVLEVPCKTIICYTMRLYVRYMYNVC